MTREFKPGDKVKTAFGHGEIIAPDWGWWKVRFSDGFERPCRPSELTPADPGPDAATLLVRELCAAEVGTSFSHRPGDYTEGHLDKVPSVIAFAKYIRANPPQPLTVERVREAVVQAGFGERLTMLDVEAIHAALTERSA